MNGMRISDWRATWITPEEETKPETRQGAGYLRKKFTIKKGEILSNNENKIILTATAHGLYECKINGQRVSDALLTPGCDEYEKRLQYQCYDITELLQEGENEIFVTLGDGWYRGCNGIDGVRNLFGEDLSFLCQMQSWKKTDGFEGEFISEPLVVTDHTWEACEKGPITLTDLELGEDYDARKEGFLNEKALWHDAREIEGSFENLVPTETVPIRAIESFVGKRVSVPNKEVVYDFEQNIAGYTELIIKGAKEGQKITLIHGETLDENGNFTIENFQPGDRNQSGGIKQEIHYICQDGDNSYHPLFSMFGFRYVKVETDIDLATVELRSRAVYSDMGETARFVCGNEDLNQLFQNSLWSMKSNFCDIPTDCPTRERAGWTGDAGVFVRTGTYLMKSFPVYKKWLANVRLNQHEDGKMAYISPKNGKPGKIAEMFSASVGWGDAAVIVPYEVYEKTGDISVLEENYDMMKRWVNFLSQRAGKTKLKHRFGKNPYRKYIIDTGMDYGEWCEPGANVMETMKKAFSDGQPEVATAYFAYSSRILSKVAGLLGKTQDENYFEDLAENATKAYRYLQVKDGHIETDRQCELVRPIAFSLLTEEEEKMAAKDLNDKVTANGYHLNTGFLSTPFLCFVLCKHGYVETAYKLLLQKECPSWLYAVTKGATTIWETWDGIKEDGSVHDSLNHYSYGAVSGFLISGVCGIQYRFDDVRIQPYVNASIGFAKGCYDSPRGRIVSEWFYEKESDSYHYHVEIPEGISAVFIKENGDEISLTQGSYDF
ncbi:MAG: glycoside hydrolase family 78 protein [Lachnospiraceae bacterium]|nr:glycoside hydrolase family 78 protein [Lachnospiraceae bacterium]